LKNTGEKSELENFFKLQLKNTDEQTEDTRGTKCRGQAPDREKVKQQIFLNLRKNAPKKVKKKLI